MFTVLELNTEFWNSYIFFILMSGRFQIIGEEGEVKEEEQQQYLWNFMF